MTPSGTGNKRFRTNLLVVLANIRGVTTNPWLVATGANVLIGLMGMATAGLTARLLGPSDRGVLAAAVLWSTMIFSALGMPVAQAVVYQWSRVRTPQERGAVAGAALALAAISATLCIIFSLTVNHWVLRGYMHPEVFLAANVVLFSLPFSLVAGAIGAAFLASGKGSVFWGIRVLSGALYFGAVAAVGLAGIGSVFWCAFAMVVGPMIATVWATARFRRHFPDVTRWNRATFRELTSFSLKANGIGLPTQVNLRLAQALMTILVPAAALGQYAVASTWSGVVLLLGGGLSNVLLARSAAAGADADEAQMTSIFAQFRVVAVAVLFLGGSGALASPLVVPLLFGKAFGSAVLPAALLCIGAAIFTLTLAVHEIARGFGHPGVGIPAEIAALTVSAVFLVLLLPPFAGTGAAVASVLGSTTSLVVLTIRLDSRLSGRLLPAIIPGRRDVGSLIEAGRRVVQYSLASSNGVGT